MTLRDQIDLNAPAFGANAQKLEDIGKDASVEEPVEQVIEEEPVESVEETKVPYSRFKNIHERAKEAEAQADYYRQRAEELEQSRSSRHEQEDETEMPSYWKKLYGDSEASQEAWTIQQQREEAIERRAYEAGQRGAEELKYVEREKINQNVATIDEHFEDLEARIGRDLSEKEQSAILDIVDDYTAKDNDGNYQGALMPFDKAWEVYELKNASSRSATRQSRDNVAALSGTSSQGNTTDQAKKDESWNPLARGSWRNRL
jgi:hypothetical protein